MPLLPSATAAASQAPRAAREDMADVFTSLVCSVSWRRLFLQVLKIEIPANRCVPYSLSTGSTPDVQARAHEGDPG